MPKKAVAIYFLAAFVGAVLFVYFTFPRTKAEIPTSNNQRPFPAGAPEPVAHLATPAKLPPGPPIRVMAWATDSEAKALEDETDAFAEASGRKASLTIVDNPVAYRQDLREALASATPPDVCLIDSRDFSGADPDRDLAEVKPNPGTAARAAEAFTVATEIHAVPNEFSVDVLYYNTTYFDRAGIAYPGTHWNWDILEADSRAIASLKLADPSGQRITPIEMPADFDFWNVLCAQAGHAAILRDEWHLSDPASHDSQMRALNFIDDFFQKYAIALPPPKPGEMPGRAFAQQQTALLIAPSELAHAMPRIHFAVTLLPSDISRASLARVNGWAVAAKSTQPDAARALAAYLAWQPVHAGWSPVQEPHAADDSLAELFYQALGQSVVPQLGAGDARLVHYLNQQIYQLSITPNVDTEALYKNIQSAAKNGAP